MVYTLHFVKIYQSVEIVSLETNTRARINTVPIFLIRKSRLVM